MWQHLSKWMTVLICHADFFSETFKLTLQASAPMRSNILFYILLLNSAFKWYKGFILFDPIPPSKNLRNWFKDKLQNFFTKRVFYESAEIQLFRKKLFLQVVSSPRVFLVMLHKIVLTSSLPKSKYFIMLELCYHFILIIL